MKREVAFTLVEVIISLVILGILASLAVPAYSRIKERFNDREAKSNLVAIIAAEEIYNLENLDYYSTPSDGVNSNGKLDLNLLIYLPYQGESWDPNYQLIWNYSTKKYAQTPKVDAYVCAQANRNGDDNRKWRMKSTENSAVAGVCP